jgi:hypothetical protein
MWKEKISLEEAVDLSNDSKYEESRGKSRWTETMWYVIEWENSPTGFVGFSYEIPRNEDQGIFDVNYSNEIELTAVQPKEVITTIWEVVE